jgi:hypothetical protein
VYEPVAFQQPRVHLKADSIARYELHIGILVAVARPHLSRCRRLAEPPTGGSYHLCGVCDVRGVWRTRTGHGDVKVRLCEVIRLRMCNVKADQALGW